MSAVLTDIARVAQTTSKFSTDFLLDRQSAQRSAITDAALRQTLSAWEQLENLDGEAEVDSFLAKMFPVVETAQVLTGNVTASYLTALVGLALDEPQSASLTFTVPRSAVTGLRRTPFPKVYRRPIIVAATALAGGATLVVARKLAKDRLTRLVQDDIGLAHRGAAMEVINSDDRITGYRRVVRPELSRDGLCGLCIAASGQRYSRDDLMPLHTRCNCEVAPIVQRESGGVSDPGRVINRQDIDALYLSAQSRAGGTTDRQKLAETRYAVHWHGELGPVLRRAGDHFQGPADVAEAA